MQCPSCSSPVEGEKRHGHFRVCPHCHTSFLLDRKAARVAGEMAVLAQPSGPLYVGAAGSVGRERFRVLGRVRYGWQSGYWDEWYLLFDDGETGWISEDGDDFTLERWTRREHAPLSYDDARPGTRVKVGKHEYHVDERGVAVCEGGEGQLPFAIEMGEEVRFLDLRGDDSFLTIEFEAERGMRVFHGTSIERNQIAVDVPRAGGPDLSGVEREATAGARQRIVKQAGRALKLACDRCGGDLDVAADVNDSVSCKHCGSRLDLTTERIACPSCDRTVPVYSGDVAQVICAGCSSQLGVTAERVEILSKLKSRKRPKVPFVIGQKCRFDGEQYVLVGHIRYREKDGASYEVSDEFLLWSKQLGYRWLLLEKGHFSLAREISERPCVRWGAKVKSAFTEGKRRYRVYWCGKAEISWVDGELNWVAAVGDRLRYLDAIDPPYLLSGEFTDQEAEWYEARYLTRSEVATAFGTTVNRLPPPRGVAANQPYSLAPFLQKSAWIALAFCLVNLLFVALFSANRGNFIGEFQLNYDDYAAEAVTDTFEVELPDQLCELDLSAGVNNSWVYVDLALVDANERVIHELATTISYYHGTEGGESWSEGSRRERVPFKLKDPGSYRLLVAGQAGTGEQPGKTGPLLTIRVREGIVLRRWFFVLGILCGVWAFSIWLHRVSFETRRWSAVVGDDE